MNTIAIRTSFFIILSLSYIGINLLLSAHAEPVIDIYSKPEKLIPVVIGEFSYSGTNAESISNVLNSILLHDLGSCGLFIVHSNNTDLSNNVNNGNTKAFSALRSDGFSYIVTGKVVVTSPSEYNVVLKIWDSFSENIILEKKYTIIPTALRKLGHTIADAIMLQLTGKHGFFNSKILYVSDHEINKKQSHSRITIADQDGHNQKSLTPEEFFTSPALTTKEPAIVMTPSYCPKNNIIAYVAVIKGNSQVNILDATTGKSINLSKIFPILANKSVLSPSLSPNGQEIAVSVTEQHGTNIYKLNFATRKSVKLTNGGINVSPSFSPNGNYIVYSSDIEGKQNLYIIDSNGWNSRRLSTGVGAYHEPSWSPDGRWIVFTKMLSNVFYIGIVSLAGGDEKLLAANYMSANPSWSPSSREIIFTRRKNSKDSAKMVILSLNGKENRIIKNIENVSDPFWAVIN